MPTEIFNPNPTIFTPSKPLSRASHLESRIWAIEDDAAAPQLMDDSDEVEPIDTDEIFGA